MCTNAISLMTRGMVCCGETIQRFIIPLNLNLNNDLIKLNNLYMTKFNINIASIENNINMKFKDFNINIKNPNTFKILSIHC